MPMSPRLLRPQATGFNPKSLSGLLVWMDASDSSTYTIATGVSEWRDKSGNQRSFIQGVGNNQPIISATKQNGKSLLEFDGGNDKLTAAGNFLQIANCTMVAAYRRTSGAYGGILASSGDSDNSPGILIDTNRGAIRGYINTSLEASGAADAFHIVVGTVTNGATVTYTNGTQISTSVASGTLGTDQTTTSIGTYRQAALNFFAGYLGEILAWNRVLSTTERQTVERWLGKRWGVTVA
ncbi:MAG: hypothetical protein EBR82_33055 [Caulobacteraceae bacterium]|nr:hypothetical protein [Caulobacteraceae bacterium]